MAYVTDTISMHIILMHPRILHVDYALINYVLFFYGFSSCFMAKIKKKKKNFKRKFFRMNVKMNYDTRFIRSVPWMRS